MLECLGFALEIEVIQNAQVVMCECVARIGFDCPPISSFCFGEFATLDGKTLYLGLDQPTPVSTTERRWPRLFGHR